MSWIYSVNLQQYCLSKVILVIDDKFTCLSYMKLKIWFLMTKSNNSEFLSVMLKNNSTSPNYSTEKV